MDDLEILNKEYVQFKSDLEKVRKNIEDLENKANDLADDKMIWKGKLVEAKRNGDAVTESTAKGEIDRIDTEIKTVQNDTLKTRQEMKLLQAKVNIKIKEIKENPEIKKHLDQVMSKKYDRKLSQLEHEKEEFVEKRDRLANLKQLVNDHSSLKNNLIGILAATKEIKNLEQEIHNLRRPIPGSKLSGWKDPVRAIDIISSLMPQAKAKLTTNKTLFMNYITKNSLDITEKDIDELAMGLVSDGKGNIDINATMDKSIACKNRKIKSYDKSIKNYTIALNNKGYGRSTKSGTNNSDKGVQQTSPQQQALLVQNKPKWYQFVQRLKNWRNRKKQQALLDPVTSLQDEKNNAFRDSLKYEVVQDAVKQMQEEELKQAKKERKSGNIDTIIKKQQEKTANEVKKFKMNFDR